MRPLSVEKRRQLTQSRMAFWQVLREAMAADLAASRGAPAERCIPVSPERAA